MKKPKWYIYVGVTLAAGIISVFGALKPHADDFGNAFRHAPSRYGHKTDLPRFFQPAIAEDFSTSANSLGVR